MKNLVKITAALLIVGFADSPAHAYRDDGDSDQTEAAAVAPACNCGGDKLDSREREVSGLSPEEMRKLRRRAARDDDDDRYEDDGDRREGRRSGGGDDNISALVSSILGSLFGGNLQNYSQALMMPQMGQSTLPYAYQAPQYGYQQQYGGFQQQQPFWQMPNYNYGSQLAQVYRAPSTGNTQYAYSLLGGRQLPAVYRAY